MPVANATEFIDLLAKTEQGQAFLVNVWDSFHVRLVRRQLVRHFFEACACAHKDGALPMVTVRTVSNGFGLQHTRLRGFRGRCTGTHGDGQTWSTVTSWAGWWHKHLNRDFFVDTGLEIPGCPGNDDPVSVAQMVERIVQEGSWYLSSEKSTGAWLGGPPEDMGHCWVSTTDLDADLAPELRPPSQDTQGSALEVQHALGLLHPRQMWLLRYEFPAQQGRALSGGQVARPHFADGGNTRFRVRHVSLRARHYARLRWGTTGHLGGRVGAASQEPVGRPERVTASLPVERISGLKLRVVGPVHGEPNRGTTAEIVEWLCDKRALAPLIAKVRRLCA